jgi:hypothetical protein
LEGRGGPNAAGRARKKVELSSVRLIMAEGGNRDAGDVKEKRAFNLLFFAGGGAERSGVLLLCEPRLTYKSSVIAIRLEESERSSRSGRMLGAAGGLMAANRLCRG